MEEDGIRLYVEAIKFAAGSLQYKNIPVKQNYRAVVQELYHRYKNIGDQKYLEVAALHIRAYLEMGFPYEENAEAFEKILEHLGTTREERFPKKFYKSKKIKLNKSQVRRMIKRWPASPKQKQKIGEVIEEIIRKTKEREDGIYYYKCAVTGDMYELVVSETETFFHDVGRGIFYTFED